ncbi:MAG: helix-turn-helix domain-containing protein [Leptolyngbyaceae cyanobacterium RU_5_1]|nr:helix-turn-helix domain-containing protein [Leptolyngbyaceae cyanobacterium RU_5_1]
MIAPKLSDSEKKQILELYRQTGETASTLAKRYGVSTSTVSRILKSNIPADEYEALIQQKRTANRSVEDSPVIEAVNTPEMVELGQQTSLNFEEVSSAIAEPEPPLQSSKPSPPIKRRSRKRSLATQSMDEEDTVSSVEPSLAEASLLQEELLSISPSPRLVSKADEEPDQVQAEVLQEILSEERLDRDEGLADLEEDDLDDELDEDEDEDDALEYDLSNPTLLVSSKLQDGAIVQILPLEEATIPKTCYLVVDRAAELITRPLREFGDLGQIPDIETQARTLPVFDNHRVAKRYSNPRTHRIIKLPDGRVLQRASSHLQAKGITRLLIDGRVYSL